MHQEYLVFIYFRLKVISEILCCGNFNIIYFNTIYLLIVLNTNSLMHVLLTIPFDYQDAVHQEFLPQGCAFNNEYYITGTDTK